MNVKAIVATAIVTACLGTALVGRSTILGRGGWEPYTATFREVVETVDENGHVKDSHVLSTGTMMRWADGSEVTAKVSSKGTSERLLRPESNGKTYKLYDQSKRAVLIGVGRSTRPHMDYNLWSGRQPGTRIIAGLPCVGFTAKNTNANEASHGTSWVSPEHELTVLTEISLPLPGGDQRVVRMELLNVSFGVEPPRSELSIPAGYELTESIATSCTACKAKQQSANVR